MACMHPKLVLTYLRTDVAGRSGRSGGAPAAWTLRHYVSNLSMCFAHRGQTKLWDKLVSIGNPVLSQTVRDHVEVIERLQHAAGQHAHSTPPVSLDVVRRLLQHLDSSASAAVVGHNCLDRLRCVRDACMHGGPNMAQMLPRCRLAATDLGSRLC